MCRQRPTSQSRIAGQLIFSDDGADPPLFNLLEIVPVEALPFTAKNSSPLCTAARVDGVSCASARVAVADGDGKISDSGKGQVHAVFPRAVGSRSLASARGLQTFRATSTSSSRMVPSRDLHLFMPLAGQRDDVTGFAR